MTTLKEMSFFNNNKIWKSVDLCSDVFCLFFAKFYIEAMVSHKRWAPLLAHDELFHHQWNPTHFMWLSMLVAMLVTVSRMPSMKRLKEFICLLPCSSAVLKIRREIASSFASTSGSGFVRRWCGTTYESLKILLCSVWSSLKQGLPVWPWIVESRIKSFSNMAYMAWEWAK